MQEYRALAWAVFGLYIVVTTGLAIYGMMKTKDLKSFALGNGDMNPILVGITLAASIASTATFQMNPGLVWMDGVAALSHLALAGAVGVTVGLVLLSKGFRRVGTQTKALTLPHWIGARFNSPWMRTYFALLNLAVSISFVVMIIKGCAILMGTTVGLSYVPAVFLIVGFVFTYIFIGGTYAHAFTNALQGTMMIGVALTLFISGLYLMGDGGVGGFFSQLEAAKGPEYVSPVSEESQLFPDIYTVFICGFVIGFGLVCQPHILMKSLYLKSDKDVNWYLVVSAVIGTIFTLILFTGLYARLAMPDYAITAETGPDTVVADYINVAFNPVLAILLSVAILAAGMSTMDGILVSASTIAGSDLFQGILGERLFPDQSDEQRAKMGLWASRIILALMGVVALSIALNPPTIVALFAQLGVYTLVAASMAPVVFGIFVKHIPKGAVFAGAILGPVVHFTHYFGYIAAHTSPERPVVLFNPGVSATSGTLVCFVVVGAGVLYSHLKRGAGQSAASGSTPIIGADAE